MLRKRPKPTAGHELHTWAISRIKGAPAVRIGHVEAPDAATAIKEAIRQFGITNPEQQNRLVARHVVNRSSSE